MREVAFIQQNKDKWMEIEEVLSGKLQKNPDELSSLYINLINDLAYAQTYYGNSNTTRYLNFLSTSVFQKIYKTKRGTPDRLKHFFVEEVPLLMYEYRRYLWFAFGIFWVFVAIGVASAHFDDSFVRLILGNHYVDMTLRNIADGNAAGVYSDGSMLGSFVGITKNNLQVGMNMYMLGIFGGLGTLYVLLQNSIMLGSFQYFFHQQGALYESARAIWVHGAFEISGMIVEAAAGFILGASVLFPGTYSRLDALKIGFKNSFKIFLSVIPFTVVAGFLEGFVTRYANAMPLILNLLIVFGTLGFIFWYYAVYPYFVHSKHMKYATLPTT
ncbi:MAG: stage II sporulation protein M [Weeksellaceae bacterium]|nr:stage II sporulation protein M [Weeksellaceae bacterium]